MILLHYLLNLVAIALLGAVAVVLVAATHPVKGSAQTRAGRMTELLRRGAAGLWAFLVRWQEHSAWAPMCAAAALLAWIVLGALDRTAAIDLLAPLGMAPIRAVYAFLALGATLLAVKRGRRKLNDDEQKAFWDRVIAGTWRDGAVIVYLGERIFTAIVLGMFIYHFRVAA